MDLIFKNIVFYFFETGILHIFFVIETHGQ